MRRNSENAIGPDGEQKCAVAELRLVGGETTLEGHELTAAAAAAGLSVRWLDFGGSEAQAAIAAQGPGAVRLPLVIIGATTLQRPAFTDVSACLAASQLRTRLVTCERLRQLRIRNLRTPSPQAGER
jgi:hypothetical protein